MSNKDYSNLSKEELIKIINKLKQKKKFGLVWEDGKVPEKVVQDCYSNIPIFSESKGKEIKKNELNQTHVLIEGDNFHSLSVLNFTHRGKFDFIYADPPYNTGARDWKYNNDYVDSTDSFRHSKWLNFMKSRLTIAKSLLKDDGIICVTIDDYEMPRLWLLLEDIFGYDNHLGTAVIRINPGGRKSKRKIAAQHEYALFFSVSTSTKVALLPVSPDKKSHSYKKDEKGFWYEERNLRKEGQDSLAKPSSKRNYSIYRDPKSGNISTSIKYSQEILPIDTKGQRRIWRKSKEDINFLAEQGDIFYKKTKYGDQLYFKFKGGTKGETPKTLWLDPKHSASEHGTSVLDKVMGKSGLFPFPKSINSVKDCINVGSNNKDAKILDFFAGSGTTGQAVLELNKEDGGNRQFFLCTNNENKIAEEVTYQRISNCINGYRLGDKTISYEANLKYYTTDFISSNHILSINDKDKTELAQKAGCLLSIAENTLDEVEHTSHFQFFKSNDRNTAIYFQEDLSELDTFVNKVEKLENPTTVYLFSWGNKSEFESIFDHIPNINIKTIPQPILEIYKKIYYINN